MLATNPNATQARTGRRGWLLVGVAALLVGWMFLFRYTGEGDAIYHYMQARDITSPYCGLGAWCRPGYKLPLALFARFGLLPARGFTIAIFLAVLWQTIRLADDLKLRRAWLAGLMLLWLPFAFALATDTMTEIPMALGVVLALRLWLNDRWAASCLLVGFLPMVRPEGFFLGALWGCLVLGKSAIGSIPRRLAVGSLLALGCCTWIGLSWIWTGDPLWVKHHWSWAPESPPSYGTGPLLYHVYMWPLFTGPVLFVLFILGLPASFNRRMRVPWAAWGVVFGVHSILYWQGWFASCGMMRIFVCTAPVTAIICLYGWNTAADWLPRARWLGVAAGVLATACMLAQYCFDPQHLECFGIVACCDYIKTHTGGSTPLFWGDDIARVELGRDRPGAQGVLVPNDAVAARKILADLPIGAVGLWQERGAIGVDDLPPLGFEVQYRWRHALPAVCWAGDGWSFENRYDYAVVRKTRWAGGWFRVPLQGCGR